MTMRPENSTARKCVWDYMPMYSTILARYGDEQLLYIHYKKIFMADKHGKIDNISWEEAISALCDVESGDSTYDHWQIMPGGERLLAVLEPDFIGEVK